MLEGHEPRFKFIRELMKDSSEREIAEAEERFARYLDIVAEIAERQSSKKFEFKRD